MFNLIDEPWIPVVDKAGATREVSLREALYNAHELEAIRDPMPTVEFGLYRLLTALTLDLLFTEKGQVADIDELADVLRADQFDPDRIEGYFAAYHDAFDLFHPERPFLQAMAATGKKPKSVAAMVHAMPSGTSANHFHHGRDADFAVSPAAAARLLTTLAPFAIVEGSGLGLSINGQPPWYLLVLGETLFETLCLNLFSIGVKNFYNGPPVAWRNPKPPGDRHTRASYAQALTWRPRRVQLIPGPGGRCGLTGRQSGTLVWQMYSTPGDSWGDAMPRWKDPNVAYCTTKKKSSPVKPMEGRELYRDLGPLALLHESSSKSRSDDNKAVYDRPRIIDQYQQLTVDGVNPQRDLRLIVYGMRAHPTQAKIYEWQREELPKLEFRIVQNERVHNIALNEMRHAEQAAAALAGAIRQLETDRIGRAANPLGSTVAFAQRRYWAALKDPYLNLLRDAADVFEALAPRPADEVDAAITKLRTDFANVISDEATAAFDEAAEPYDATGQLLEHLTKARGRLNLKLFGIRETAAGRTVAKKGATL